jgi:CBS domain-containing protein
VEPKVKDIMVKDFSTIRPDAPVREAVRMILEGKPRHTGYKPFGIMVTDEIGRLVGMISMFDILYHLRPPFMNYEMEGAPLWKGELEPYLDQFRALRVEQVMTTPVITCAPDDPLMQVIDRMVKKRARRLPVVDSDRILGIVYLSDVFYGLCGTWLECKVP